MVRQGFLFITLTSEFISYGTDVTGALANFSPDLKLTDFKAIFKI